MSKICNLHEFPYVYMDHNATTMMSPDTMCEFVKWSNWGNASSFYSDELRGKLEGCKVELHELFGMDRNHWTMVFTGGATESNVTIIRMAVEAAEHRGRTRPHVVTSAVEHPSILAELECLGDRIKTTILPVESDGTVSVEKVKSALKSSTCLCTIMTANNETGSVNDVVAMKKVCEAANVPFHTDATQSFGKCMSPNPDSADAFSVSFHKVHGPIGVGLLVLNESVAKKFGFRPLFPGSQNKGDKNDFGWRGGTENYAGIIAAVHAVKEVMTDRAGKNERLTRLRELILTELSAHFPLRLFGEWDKSSDKVKAAESGPVILLLGNDTPDKHLPNTLFLSLYVPYELPDGSRFSNRDLMDCLYKQGVVVSIGSACKTDVHKASHVVSAMTDDEAVKCGVIRVSIGDDTTETECRKFVSAYVKCVTRQLKKGKKKKTSS